MIGRHDPLVTSVAAQDTDKRTAVLLINYRGALDTERCLRSIENSSIPVEKVVIDNTPNDKDLERVLAEYPGVHCLRPNKNLGFSGGNDFGAEWIRQNLDVEFLFILNNDTQLAENTIESLQLKMLSDRDIGIVCCRILLMEDPSRLWFGGGTMDWRRAGVRVEGFLGPAESSAALTERDVEFASGCAMLIRQSIFDELGGFDHRYFMYEEDVDLSIRVRKDGWRIRYLPDAVILHRGQGSVRSGNTEFLGKWSIHNKNFEFHAFHMVRNSMLNALKHARGRDAVLCMLGYPLFLIWKLLPHFARLRFRSAVPVLKGIGSAFQVYLSANEHGVETRG